MAPLRVQTYCSVSLHDLANRPVKHPLIVLDRLLVSKTAVGYYDTNYSRLTAKEHAVNAGLIWCQRAANTRVFGAAC